jgi:CHAD domain-containing protein
MELELRLDPDDAPRLQRLKLLAPLKSGKARSRAVKIVWHDSAERTLAEQGLALAERRTEWRLERLRPNSHPWPPGARAPVVASARTAVELGHTLPASLFPMAALEGRESAVNLVTQHGPISMTLLTGEVRSVVSQQPINRLWLEGGSAPVQALALALTSDLCIAVPPISLAAEAFAVATGVTGPPRRDGAPELPDGLSIEAAFAHVVGHLSDIIIQLAPHAVAGRQGPEPVHQMRVAVRRLRSAIKIFHRALASSEIAEADRGLKALAAKLAPTRDWDVFVTETAAPVRAAFPMERRLERLLAAAERRRRACHEDLQQYLTSAVFRRLGIELACLASGPVGTLPVEAAEPAMPLRDFAVQMLGKRHGRLAEIDDRLSTLEPAALHTIRLQAKRLRYAAEIFAPMYPGKAAHRFLRRLSRLQDCLGTLNDSAVAQHLLGELPGGSHAFPIGLVLGFVGARAQKTRGRIDRAWERFHRLEPFWE